MCLFLCRFGREHRDNCHKLIPWAAVATQVDQATGTIPRAVSGRFFRTLPLPGDPGLGVHVNAIFAVNSDRSGIIERSDAKGDGAILTEWNRVLAGGLVAPLMARLLEVLAARGGEPSEEFCRRFFELWPWRADLWYVCACNPELLLLGSRGHSACD